VVTLLNETRKRNEQESVYETNGHPPQVTCW